MMVANDNENSDNAINVRKKVTEQAEAVRKAVKSSGVHVIEIDNSDMCSAATIETLVKTIEQCVA